jgi:uncharacterized protein YycO
VQRQPFRPVEGARVRRFGPDEAVPDPTPGDFILTHGKAWTSKMIRFGQRLRIHGGDRAYTHWNHAAIITGSDGSIIEALGGGVARRNITAYEPAEVHLIRIDASDEDRAEAVAFAESCVGLPYGFATIVSIGISLLTGGKLTFAFDGQHICSGLVARAMERTPAIFNRTPSHVMPADLAKYYGVDPPPPGTPKGTPPEAARAS